MKKKVEEYNLIKMLTDQFRCQKKSNRLNGDGEISADDIEIFFFIISPLPLTGVR